MEPLFLILDNIRSVYNVGSLLRTADGCGVKSTYTCGITPYPPLQNDHRPPYVRDRLAKQLHKTALGAEQTLPVAHFGSVHDALGDLRQLYPDIEIIAIENGNKSKPITDWHPRGPSALILGPEVDGLSEDTLGLCDYILELPMYGQKESYNVASAGAMAMFYCRLPC